MIVKMRLQDIIPDKSSPTEQELNIIKSIFNGSVIEPPKPKEDFVKKDVVTVIEKPKKTNASKFTLLFAVFVTLLLLLNKPMQNTLHKINISNFFLVILIQVVISMILFYSAIKLLKF